VYINTASFKDKNKTEKLNKKTKNLVRESQIIADRIEDLCLNKIL